MACLFAKLQPICWRTKFVGSELHGLEFDDRYANHEAPWKALLRKTFGEKCFSVFKLYYSKYLKVTSQQKKKNKIPVRTADYFNDFVCKLSDLTKQCVQLDMNDCRLEKLRAAVDPTSRCLGA